MNRAQRRQAAREGAAVPPRCPTGTHAFGRVSGTNEGREVAVRVVCSTCRRTIEQVLDEDPAELARYQAWLEAGEPDA